MFGDGARFGDWVVNLFFILILLRWVVVDVGKAVGCCRCKGREVV